MTLRGSASTPLLHGLDLQRALAAAKGWKQVPAGWLPPTAATHRDLYVPPNWHTDPALALELAVELPKGWSMVINERNIWLVMRNPDDAARAINIDITHDNTADGLRVALCEAIGNAVLEGKK